MAKNILVIGVIIALAVSLWIFIGQSIREDRNKRIKSGEPIIIVDDFFVFRYRDNDLVSSFSAKLGHFVEPNVVEAFASIRAMRYRGKQVESLSCEAAHAQFDADNMGALIKSKDVQLAYGEVEDQVHLGFKDDMLRSEHAQYYGDRDLVSSREPVQIDGPNRTFIGDSGFFYNLTTQVLELPGEVRGTVKPQVRP